MMLMTLFGTPRHQRWLLAGALLLVFGLIWPLLDTDRFRYYGKRSSLLERQKTQGYVPVGSFGKTNWPAVVVGCDTGHGTVSFTTADGQPHEYQGFTGPMKALHFRALQTGGKGFTLVFHQPPTRAEFNPVFKGI